MPENPALPTQPILRLNTEMHTAAINRVAADARGRYVLTCSHDKTAKLWEAASGTLLRTFRPPIGLGNDGKLYACALSPNGRMVAVGGWSQEDDIYIFDSQTGQIRHRIKDLPNVINDLAYSEDGRYLVAGLFGENGIRVFQSSNHQEVARDDTYGGDCHGLAFDTQGRLASVAFDGHLRLYDNNFTLLKKVKCSGGARPYSVAFSPNGALLAVGYSDSAETEIYDGSSLKRLYQPNLAGAEKVSDRLDGVAFSADGRYLVAGGFLSKKIEGEWWRIIRVWSDAGKGDYVDIPAGKNTIMDVIALPDGNLLYGSAAPDWGIIDPVQKKRTLYQPLPIYAYNANDKSHFRIGPGGTSVGITPLNKSPIRFSVPDRKLQQATSSNPSYRASGNGIEISDWKNSYQPKLNGNPVSFLKTYEINSSVDIATGGKGIAWGTGWYVRLTDARGQIRWWQPTSGSAWCVKIDAYCLVVVAALGDGTIRWYRFSDGAPLLTLFLHPDGERWLLWTPSGYYDCSPGAEELIGWHVNNGPDQAADFYPAAQFRETYYRPDVIDRILDALDEDLALKEANAVSPRRITASRDLKQILPPTVRILSPEALSEVRQRHIKIKYAIDSPGEEPITGIRLQVDGRPISVERSFKASGQVLEATVEIPASDCRVSVIAENRHGASEPATVPLRWVGVQPSTSTGVDTRPSLYVLAIGVSGYAHDQVNNLRYGHKDATDFTKLLQKQQGRLYKEVGVKLLTEQEANKDNILDGLEWLQRETTSRDVAMLFFAGHGADDNFGNFYYLPHNADPNAQRRTCLSKSDVQTTVASVAGKMLVFMDACHSGSLMQASSRRNAHGPDITGVINELISAENGAIVFSASTTRQYALENEAWNNGAFTKALLEGMLGQACHSGTRKVTVKSLDAFVAEKVKNLTNGKQTPTTVYPHNVNDFPILYVD